LEEGALSWYSPTLPATTSLCQFTVPAPVNTICFTSTFSWAALVRITCTLETLAWLKA
jgi:hypothetical protein